MDKNKTDSLFETAYEYGQANYPDVLEWANSIHKDTFKCLDQESFLYEYCWAVYASGFKYEIIKAKFPEIKAAYKDFDLDKIVKMRTAQSVLKVFNNELKANAFLRGCRLIYDEGFDNFKTRLSNEGIDTLEELGGIGKVVKYHLAKNIGLADCAKPDIWMVRIADYCNGDLNEIVQYLCKKHKLSAHAIDVILWKYCTEQGLE